jgi:hypothetical protein
LSTVVGLLPVGLLIGGFGLVALGLVLGLPGADGASVIPETAAWTLAGLGVILGVSMLVVLLRCPSWLANKYLRAVLDREFLRRREPLLDLRKRHIELVEIIPRENWRIMLNTAADIGLLRIDEKKRQILFEGDKERMSIPAAAIEECEVLCFTMNMGQGVSDSTWLAAIRVRTQDGIRELPFYPRALDNTVRKKERQALAEDLVARIRRLFDNAPVAEEDVVDLMT